MLSSNLQAKSYSNSQEHHYYRPRTTNDENPTSREMERNKIENDNTHFLNKPIVSSSLPPARPVSTSLTSPSLVTAAITSQSSVSPSVSNMSEIRSHTRVSAKSPSNQQSVVSQHDVGISDMQPKTQIIADGVSKKSLSTLYSQRSNIEQGNENLEDAKRCLVELKHFLKTAPLEFSQSDIIRQFRLPNDEQVSCVRWANVYYITGTDIVRSLVHRFSIFGREVINRKKFEEGVFSDLRNLKVNVDSTLEGPKSELLEFLYKRHCVRTKKKQKVFYWTSVHHEQLFTDALSRELKKEATVDSTNRVLTDSNFQYRGHQMNDQSVPSNSAGSTIAVREPALSFKYDPSMSLADQMSTVIANMESSHAAIFKELTTGTFDDVNAHNSYGIGMVSDGKYPWNENIECSQQAVQNPLISHSRRAFQPQHEDTSYKSSLKLQYSPSNLMHSRTLHIDNGTLPTLDKFSLPSHQHLHKLAAESVDDSWEMNEAHYNCVTASSMATPQSIHSQSGHQVLESSRDEAHSPYQPAENAYPPYMVMTEAANHSMGSEQSSLYPPAQRSSTFSDNVVHKSCTVPPLEPSSMLLGQDGFRSKGVFESQQLEIGRSPAEDHSNALMTDIDTDFPLDILTREDQNQFELSSMGLNQSFDTPYSDLIDQNRHASNFSSQWDAMNSHTGGNGSTGLVSKAAHVLGNMSPSASTSQVRSAESSLSRLPGHYVDSAFDFPTATQQTCSDWDQFLSHGGWTHPHSGNLKESFPELHQPNQLNHSNLQHHRNLPCRANPAFTPGSGHNYQRRLHRSENQNGISKKSSSKTPAQIWAKSQKSNFMDEFDNTPVSFPSPLAANTMKYNYDKY